MKEILAKAGEIVVGDRNSIITAKALGSSLGICLYDSYDRCGGFVECLLPKCTKDERCTDAAAYTCCGCGCRGYLWKNIALSFR